MNPDMTQERDVVRCECMIKKKKKKKKKKYKKNTLIN